MLKAAFIRLVYLLILFFASLILSNLAHPEKFGVLSMLILNASLLTLITGFGLDSMVLYKLSNKLWDVSQAFRLIWLGIFLQLTIFGLLELGSWFLFHRTLLCSSTPDYFIIESAYFIGLVIVEKYLSLYYAQNQAGIVNRILASVAFSYLLLLVLFYYVINVEWVYILLLFGFQNIVQALVLVIRFKKNDILNAAQNPNIFGVLRISSVIMITNLIQLMAYRLDFWMINYFYNNYEVGIYAQANKFANFSWIIPNIVSQILIPKFASMKKSDSSQIFSLGFYSNFLIIFLTVVFAQFFYFFFLDTEYQAGLTAFYLMLPGYFFWASVIYFGNYFSAKGKFVFNLIGSFICFILIFAADIILIPNYGINGAGMANTVAYFSVFMVYLYILMKKSSFRWNELLLAPKKSFFNIFKMVSK